jgi:hypothetical protein
VLILKLSEIVLKLFTSLSKLIQEEANEDGLTPLSCGRRFMSQYGSTDNLLSQAFETEEVYLHQTCLPWNFHRICL